MTLCSYANFRSSYHRLEGISYLVGPGEWICKASELAEWFRTRFQHQALSILDFLQKQNYIAYTRLGWNNLIKFSITGWKQHDPARLIQKLIPKMKKEGKPSCQIQDQTSFRELKYTIGLVNFRSRKKELIYYNRYNTDSRICHYILNSLSLFYSITPGYQQSRYIPTTLIVPLQFSNSY